MKSSNQISPPLLLSFLFFRGDNFQFWSLLKWGGIFTQPNPTPNSRHSFCCIYFFTPFNRILLDATVSISISVPLGNSTKKNKKIIIIKKNSELPKSSRIHPAVGEMLEEEWEKWQRHSWSNERNKNSWDIVWNHLN